MSNLQLTGTLVHTNNTGAQCTEELLSVLRNNFSEGNVGSKKVIAAAATEALNLVDAGPSAGSFFVLISDQPLAVTLNASLTPIPCNELLVITASTVSGTTVDSVSVQNLSATTAANIRFYFVK